MTHRRSYVFARIKSSGLTGSNVLRAALLCLLLVSAVACPAQAATTVKQGSTLPVYLPPAAFTEANQPGVEIAVFGASYFKPGPERLYGYALRDLRDYLQKMTGAQFPLTALDANAKSGVFAGTFAQFPNFKPQQANSQKRWPRPTPKPLPSKRKATSFSFWASPIWA